MVFTGIFFIIIIGLASRHSNISRAFEMKTSYASSVTFSAVFTAMLAAFWAYQGWASIGYVGGEIKNANRNIPKGIVTGVLIIIATYLLVNATYLSLLPVQDIEKIHQAGNKIAAVEAVRVFWGVYGALFISLLICLTTLGCTNATILTSSRIYFAMAEEKLLFHSVQYYSSIQFMQDHGRQQ